MRQRRACPLVETSYIPLMPNLSNVALSAEQGLFIEDLAGLLIAWNMSGATARLFGYLLIRNDPASLDEIAVDLEISKTTACVAAKDLERQGNARRLRERGTKRILYVIGDDPGAPLHKQIALLTMMAGLIGERADGVATGEARDRMLRLSRFHHDLGSAMRRVVMPGARD
jgi:DNA-binding MarR family transcriptional regulator